MDRLSRSQRLRRIVITVLGAVLLVAGTAWGSDDDFPFGPFRMFAGVNGPNEDAPDPRVEGADATGRSVLLVEETTGIRRAEIESRQDRYAAHPALLKEIAVAYAQRHPTAPPVVEIRLIVRWHEIRASRPTGRHRDETLAVWRGP